MLPGSDTGDAAPAPEPADDGRPGVRSVRRAAVLLLAALGVLAAGGAFVEDAGASWSALYLRDGLAAGAVTAGLGFVVAADGDDAGPADRRLGSSTGSASGGSPGSAAR